MVRRLVLGVCVVMLLVGIGTAMAQVTTKKITGTVVAVEGNNLLVKMANGEVQVFTPPADRKFIIDGKELTLAELQPGTKLTATVTETKSETMTKTVQTVEGTVFYAKGPTVVLILPSGDAKKYVITHDAPVEFQDQNGKPLTVFDLKKGMNIKARKITEAPLTQIATDTQVTGTMGKKMAENAPPAAEPAKEAPKMPKTGSSLPLAAGLGLLFIGLALGIRRFL